MKGLMAPDDEEALCPTIVSTEENKANTERTIKEWRLGPLKPSDEPDANKPYWQDMARVWNINDKEARRQLCDRYSCVHRSFRAERSGSDRRWRATIANLGPRGRASAPPRGPHCRRARR